MKLLLTSAGVKNASIHDALVELLGKPIEEASALCVPTASYGLPHGSAGAYRIISGTARTPMSELGLAVSGRAGPRRAAQPATSALGSLGRGS